jgi:hypothetical protein
MIAFVKGVDSDHERGCLSSTISILQLHFSPFIYRFCVIAYGFHLCIFIHLYPSVVLFPSNCERVFRNVIRALSNPVPVHLFPRSLTMAQHHDGAPVKSANTALPTVSILLASSGAWWAFYAVPLRRKEWLDIMLDYGHHKRTRYAPNLLDNVTRAALRLMRIRA